MAKRLRNPGGAAAWKARRETRAQRLSDAKKKVRDTRRGKQPEGARRPYRFKSGSKYSSNHSSHRRPNSYTLAMALREIKRY